MSDSVIALFDEAIGSIDRHESFAFDIETTGLDPLTTDLLVLSLATEDGAWAIPFAGPVPHLRWQDPEMFTRIQHVFSNPQKLAISWNGGFDDKHLIYRGFDLKTRDADGMVGVWLLDEMLAKTKMIGLKKQAKIVLGVDMSEFEDTRLLEGIVDEQALAYARDDAKYTYVIWHDHVWPKLQEEGLTKVFERICMPVLRVLSEMELNGCTIDVEQLKKIEKDLIVQNDEVLLELQAMSGNPKFNPGSSKQLATLLFGQMSVLKIPVKRGHEWKVKSKQWSTDKRTLRRYKNDHPIFEKLTAYRKSKKLLSTYATPLQERALASKDGRVRSSYRQTGTVCVRHDTLIPTDRGLVEISSLLPTCESVSPLECRVATRTGTDVTSQIVHNGVRPTRRIRTRLGFELEGTTIHPVWTNRHLRNGIDAITQSRRDEVLAQGEWVQLGDLREGDYVQIRRGTEIFGDSTDLPKFTPVYRTNAKRVSFPRALTPDLALFVGAYVAEGSIHTSNGGGSIRISRSDLHAKARVAESIERVFGITPGVFDWGVEVVSAEMVRFCLDILQFKVGAHLKCVPDYIRRAPKDCVLAFLSGVYLDSTALPDMFGIRFQSTSLDVSRWVHAQLLNLGIVGSYRVAEDLGTSHHIVGNADQTTLYTVTCKGRNAGRLASVVVPLRSDILSYLGQDRPKRTCRGYIERNDGVVWLRVESIQDSTADVWDLTVPGSECFIGNGVVSHNTGRLSSSNPNFQNISTKGGIREAFIPADGCLMIVADYNQLELRMGGCIAHRIFGKSNIVEKYRQGLDLHEATRQTYDALGIDRFNEATVGADEARRNAKIANFGYFYGRSADAFEQDNPEVSYEEAMMLRELFLVKLYPEITAMHDHSVKELVENGLVQTITGRRRRFRYCYGRDPQDIWWEGWVAWNSTVQGCQDPDGLILTDSGYVHLRDLDSRKHVLITEHGPIYDYRVCKVGKKQAFSIETDAGAGVFSGDHRFGVYESGEESYVPLKTLSAGTWMIGATPVLIEGREANRRCGPDEAYLLGALIGDGSYSSKKNHVSIYAAGNCQEYIDLLVKLLSSVWTCSTKWASCTGSRGNTKRTCINRKDVRERLLDLGLERVSGSRKAIPEWLYDAPITVRVNFLQGLMDTDGGFTSNRIVFTSISKNVALGVWRLLESLGIPAQYRGRRQEQRVYVDTAYTSVYRRVVGFRHPRKIARLDEIPDSRGHLPSSLISEVGDFILAQPEMRQLIDVRVDTSSEAWERTSIVRRRLLYTDGEFHLLRQLRAGSGSRASCLEMLAKLPQSAERDRLQQLCSRRWVRLTSVRRLGEMDMMDIESFAQNKSYVGAGIAQHNSAQDLIQIAMRDVFSDICVGRNGGPVETDDQKTLSFPADVWKRVKPLIQVHDELVVEAPADVANDIAIWLSYRMGRAVVGQPVDFPAEAGIGQNWISAKQAPKNNKHVDDDIDDDDESEDVA